MINIIFCLLFSFCLSVNSLVFAQAEAQPQNKISLDIKGMDVVDVLKMLSTRANLNMVVGKNVTGRVTLFLHDVDVWDAFEIILLANDLAYEKNSGIINIMTQRDYELIYGERYKDQKKVKVIPLKYAKATDLSRALTQIKTNIGKVVVDDASNTIVLIDSPEKIKDMEEFILKTDLPIQTRVFNLNYAQAEKLNSKLQESLTKGVGVIKIDERTNKIAVTDYPGKLNEIAKIVSAFDEKTLQVLIDAQIIEIKPSDKFEMGVDWDYWIMNHFKIASAMPVGTSERLTLGTASVTPTKSGEYKAILDVLRTIGDAKVLSSPRIMTLNNQEAKILVGTKDAYITSTTSQGGTGTSVTSQSVNFVDVGIKLYVTPVINRDGFVTMKIKPEISSATRTNITSEGSVTQIPIVTTSESETTVMVKDGVTIIIGGLKKDERTKTVKKIPVISDIPGLGFFFRNTSDEAKKTELVILLTPHIMSGEKSYTDFSEIKPVDGAVMSMSAGTIITERVTPDKNENRQKEAWKEYYKMVSDKIQSLISFTKPESEKGVAALSFIINSNGELEGEPKVASYSNKNLSDIAVSCVKNAAPFKPFPKEIDKPKESFSMAFEYK